MSFCMQLEHNQLINFHTKMVNYLGTFAVATNEKLKMATRFDFRPPFLIASY